MKKLLVTAVSVLGLSTFAMGQSPAANQTDAKPAAQVSEKDEDSCDKKRSWWSWGKKRHHHRGGGMGKLLKMSEPIRTALTAQAKADGHDLSTRSGKKAFFKAMKAKKKAWVKDQGVDMKDREARRAFRKKVKADQQAEAEKLGFDLDSLAGKELYAVHMIKNGRAHELSLRGKSRRHHDDDDR